MDATQPVIATRHSPALSADLVIRGERFTVAALGPDHVVIHSARAMPPGRGTIRLKLDDHVTTYRVDLVDGLDPSRDEQVYRLLEPIEDAA